jgi:glycosyltransferase involved in cell wall biosynthesis
MRKYLKRISGKTTATLGVDVRRINRNERKVVSLKPENMSRGNVLLSYIIEPFLLKAGEPVSNDHTHDWESLQIGKTFLELGYSVDVIDYRNNKFIPEKDYSFFVAARTNFERISQYLNKNCMKIVHLDTSHWLYNNHASYERSLAMQIRKGATVRSQRIVESNLAIEYADCATILGNDFTISTYQYAKKPVFRIPISTCAVYPWPEEKDFNACRKNFLWFGSGGLIHKGLDLVLDVFAQLPDYHVTICGPIQNEEDFVKTFYKELYQTSNIHAHGWVNVNSEEFIKIMNNCIGLIYPSSAEGQCGAVIACMHGGLIPVISYESGVDVGDFGVILRDCSIDQIKNTIQIISHLPVEKLKGMALKTWEFARAHHTRERFAEEYRKVITKIINTNGNKDELLRITEE